MAPQKRSRKGNSTLKQTSLLDHLQSSPPSAQKKSRYSSSVSPKKQARVQAESSDESSDIGAIKFQPAQKDKYDDEEEEEAARPGPSSTGRRRITRAVTDSDDSDSSVIITAVKKNGKLQESTKGKLASASSSEEEIKPRKRRKLIRGTRPDVAESSEDDLETEHILNSRLRTRGKKTAFQKNLERLKRKKQGKPMESSEEEDGSGDEQASDNDIKPFKGAKPHVGGKSDDEEEDEVGSDDFIVEDDGETASLPAIFSMESHQDLSHQFKKIFQFLVHVATRTPADRHDFVLNTLEDEEYFAMPLGMMRRKLLGLRDSLVASSVWRPPFKKALDTRPDVQLIRMDYAVPGCDACHLGSRMSTYSLRVSGNLYDKVGYESYNAASDSESGSDDDSENERSRKTFDFNVGRFCARRAKVYHDLTHWEYSLFQIVNDEVSSLKASAGKKKKQFVRVAFAGGKKPPEDLQDADAICEWMDERKVIDLEWQKLKGIMDSARNLEVAAKKGEDLD